MRRVLYRLPEVLRAVEAGEKVYVVEGEKDADALSAVGVTATCNPFGAGKWSESYTKCLQHARVVVVADKDGPGRKHAQQVVESLTGVVKSVSAVEAAAGKDASDHLAAGFGLEDFVPHQHDGGVDEAGSSWGRRIDLRSLVEGGDLDHPPTMLRRIDGVPLIYPGRVHAFNGESEAMKSWAALVLCAERMTAGEHVVYLDFEDHPKSVIERLLSLGADSDDVVERFIYVRPDGPLDDEGTEALDGLFTDVTVSVVVMDGVTEAMALNGWSVLDNDDVAKFLERLPRRIARHGPAVVLIDHVAKDRQARGRYAIGAQHKLSGIDGAAYTFEVITPFGRGREGAVKLTVAKDRPGHVREHEVAGRRIAELHLHSHPDGSVTAELRPPEGTGAEFRPTCLMERLSKEIEAAGAEGLTTRDALASVTGKKDARQTALRFLVQDGFVAVEKKGRSLRHTSVRPYRQHSQVATEDEEDG